MSSHQADKRSDPLLVDVEGHIENLLGNEAIVRGALEAGVGFASGYPGTPSSEVTDSFARVSKTWGIPFEYSVNEKIALEIAYAASLAGTRSICAMKHLGLMYAGDPLSTIPYTGIVGGMVIVSAGDPSCRTSPNEQDQRYLSDMLHIPLLDPSTPQEAYEMARFAFELSERSSLPVIIRITTHVCHSRGAIKYGKLRKPEVKGFVRNPQRFVPLPANAVKLRLEINERLEKAHALMSKSNFVRQTGSGRFSILATGAPAALCVDLMAENAWEEKITLLVMGTVFPLPQDRLLDFLSQAEQVLIVEELSPYLEDKVRALCSLHGFDTKILGKRTHHLPTEFEYGPEMLFQAICQYLGIDSAKGPSPDFTPVPPRPPILCPGCPHRSTYFAARSVFGEEYLYFNDIGCYTLGYGPPLNTVDAVLCMGASFTMASGVSRVTGKRTIGFLGDSTFFHSGIPALLNAAKEDANIVAVILDNQVTAMTGFQESPAIRMVDSYPVRDISIEAIVRELGVRQVETVDPHDLVATFTAFERAKEAKGISVVIAKQPCPVFMSREGGLTLGAVTYEVADHLCQVCGREADGLRCKQGISEAFERNMARSRALETVKRKEPIQVAPCSSHCPLSICIQGYIGSIAAGQYDKALEQIMDFCPLPETVCRVCHRPCESVCLRQDMDESIAINDLKRFVVEWAEGERVSYNPTRQSSKGKKVAVVGAGPSGLAAAHDLTLFGFDVTLFDDQDEPGGLLLSGIPEYRLPREALKRDVDRILGLGVRFEGEKELFKDFSCEDLLAEGYDAVYLALGAHQEIRMGLQDGLNPDSKPVVVDALAYLKGIRRKEEVETGKKVLVIGGGNAAIDAARTARREGAQEVTVVYRRRRNEMPAIIEEVEAAEQEGIEIKTQRQPVAIRQGKAAGLECLQTEPGAVDDSGRSRPVLVADTEHIIEGDQIIVAIGQALDSRLFTVGKTKLEKNEEGLVAVDAKTARTAHSGIFAGGDMVSNNRTLSEAIAWGKLAAWGIYCQLEDEGRAGTSPPSPATEPPVLTSASTMRRIDRAARQRPQELTVKERIDGFQEVRRSLNETQARAEASRCLVCGLCGNCRTCIDVLGCPAFYTENDKVKIDRSLCTGCGVCALICPNGAIRKVEK